MRARTFLPLLTGLAAGWLAMACGSSNLTPTLPPTLTHNVAATPPPATPTPAASASLAPADVNLSGSWSGQYSGAPYSGTFTLSWTQTGSALSGDIKVSDPAGDDYRITGTVTGSSIQFGAVGAVSYVGTVSGSSMSGSWSIPNPNGGNAGGGSWSASKS
jgi:hypothetical protein